MRSLFAAASLVAAFSVASMPAQEAVDRGMTGRIREEGLQRSRARELYLTLSDTIGARLTGSPSHMQAARWARERLAEWGLADARLEPFRFGRGWSLEKISVEMTAPRYMPLMASADAWTPSIAGVLSGRAVYIGDKTAAQIAVLGSQLRGAIVLTHLPQAQFIDTDRPQPGLSDQPVRTGNPASPSAQSTTPAKEFLPMLRRTGARVALKPSAYRDGTVGVLGNRETTSDAIPSITVAAEQYNMLARLTAANVPVELRIELRTRYQEGNAAAQAIFDGWLEPLKDLGVTRNIIEGIGSTDHVPFNEAGLPGFNAIKDFDAYDERTRHTNADFPERMSADDLKQSAIVLATFAWHAAMRDERIPRASAIR